MDTTKWVKKAVSKDQSLPALCDVAYLDGRTVGTDGQRLHIWHNGTNEPNTDQYPDIDAVLAKARAGNTAVTVSTYHLMQACKAALSLVKALPKYAYNGPLYITLSVADVLYCASKEQDRGRVSVYIKDGDNWPSKATKVKYPNGRPNIATYTKNGPSLYITIDVRYLLDALRGMDEVVDIRFSDSASPMYMRSNGCEAVIMPARK